MHGCTALLKTKLHKHDNCALHLQKAYAPLAPTARVPDVRSFTSVFASGQAAGTIVRMLEGGRVDRVNLLRARDPLGWSSRKTPLQVALALYNG